MKLDGATRYWNSHRVAILSIALIGLVPASFIGYEHGVLRGLLFFLGVICIFLLSTIIPFIKSLRSKYGKSPF
jgi:fatty-acid desaturase